MESVVLSVIVFLTMMGSTVAAALAELRKRRQDVLFDLWSEALQASNLSEVEKVRALRARLTARSGRLGVTLEAGLSEPNTAVLIEGLPPGLTLKLESGAPASARRRGAREVEVGDLDFDQEVFVLGPAPLVHALMDASMRLRVRSLLGNEIAVERGDLRATVPNRYARGPGNPVAAVLPLLLEFACRLLRPADLVERLAANALADPVAGVRLQNLLTLARELPDHAVTRATLTSALLDPDEENRLRAASLLGPEGERVLADLASGEETGDACAARAVQALGKRLPEERTLAILNQALRARRVETASACLAALGTSRSDPALATLAKVLAREKGVLAECAARALGASVRAAAEAPLEAALAHETAAVRAAAAEALGHCGSVAAVQALKVAEERHPGDREFRRAARQAVAAIQSRAASASPGQLTLAEGESGRLSLEDDAAGHVSLATTGESTRPVPDVRD